MAAIEAPAEYVPLLQLAAVHTLEEEADSVLDAQQSVRDAEYGPRDEELARVDRYNALETLISYVLALPTILSAPSGEALKLDGDPSLYYYAAHVMAAKVCAPRIAKESEGLPMPEECERLAAASAWASETSRRVEKATASRTPQQMQRGKV
ncbi:MAG: hypothetical protein U0R71_16455 [Solirubrobacterales bacterium]